VFKKPSSKNIDNCISLLRRYEENGKIVINLDERLKIGDGKDDYYGLKSNAVANFTPRDPFTGDCDEIRQSLNEVVCFLGYGDLVARLLMILFSVEGDWTELGLTELEFDWRIDYDDSPLYYYISENEASLALMSLSKYLQKPIVFRSTEGFDIRKMRDAQYHVSSDDRGLSLNSCIENDPLDFIFDSTAFLRSVTSEY